MDKILLKMMLLCLISLLFPAGIWLGIEGYEILALFFLVIGWTPILVLVVHHFYREGYI